MAPPESHGPARPAVPPTARIRLIFLLTGQTAVADLLPADAPSTCEAIVSRLPVAAVAHHASYSGSECVMVLPAAIRVPPENATTEVRPGDVAFTWFAAGSSFGVTEEFAEICWFYDEDARPSMHEGPAPVSVFASLTGDSGPFYARCRAMRRRGVTALLIVPDPARDEPIACTYHDPSHEAPLVEREVARGGWELRLACDHDGGCCSLIRRRVGSAAWLIGPQVFSGRGRVHGATLADRHDGSLTALIAVGAPSRIWLATSPDDGATWSAPGDCGIEGAAPSACFLADGRLACVASARDALKACVSIDGGETWDETIRFGEGLQRPVALALDDGRLVCAAWGPGQAAPDTVTILTL